MTVNDDLSPTAHTRWAKTEPKRILYMTTEENKCNLNYFTSTGISLYIKRYVFYTDYTPIKEKSTDLQLVFSHEPAVL